MINKIYIPATDKDVIEALIPGVKKEIENMGYNPADYDERTIRYIAADAADFIHGKIHGKIHEATKQLLDKTDLIV